MCSRYSETFKNKQDNTVYIYIYIYIYIYGVILFIFEGFAISTTHEHSKHKLDNTVYIYGYVNSGENPPRHSVSGAIIPHN